MASLKQTARNRWLIQFYGRDRRRRSIRLEASKKDAEKAYRNIEAIILASAAGGSVPADVATWLGKISDAVHAKLARVGLVEPRKMGQEPKSETVAPTIDSFVAGYIARQADAKQSTKTHWGHTRRNLSDHFGKDKQICEVSPGDADDFRQYLIGLKLAITTVNKRCQNAKKFFAAAVRHKHISENPFAHHKAGRKTNSDRMFTVSREVITDVLAACPDKQWQLIVALARFGGLRCPSELLTLKWGDVNFEAGRFTVTAPKTERHEGKGTRLVPIFPELRPYLQAALDELLEDFDPEAERLSQKPVVTRIRNGEQNLRTTFEKIIKRAGHKPWPKLFQNLRSTRETELCGQFPLHVVCEWIGNSPKVAMEHYLSVTVADFEAASKSVGSALLNPVPQTTEINGNPSQVSISDSSAVSRFPEKPVNYAVFAGKKVGDEGLEPPTSSV